MKRLKAGAVGHSVTDSAKLAKELVEEEEENGKQKDNVTDSVRRFFANMSIEMFSSFV